MMMEQRGGSAQALQQPQTSSPTSLWATAVDHKGRTYFYNRVTRESRWDLPEEFSQDKVLRCDSNDSVGEVVRDKEGRSMYDEVFSKAEKTQLSASNRFTPVETMTTKRGLFSRQVRRRFGCNPCDTDVTETSKINEDNKMKNSISRNVKPKLTC